MREHGLSIVQACSVVKLSRTAWYRRPMSRMERDRAVIEVLREISARKARWGFWKLHDRLRLEGHRINTLISAVSAARPKVADYPFTTLHPNLGVVSVGEHRSFVMADIPGLIEGAAEGAGLGIRFLKHLQRTRVLLHLVDIAPPDPEADPVKDARAIVGELRKFSKDLGTKPRWLVLNKIDLLPKKEADAKCRDIVRRLRWKGPTYRISGVTGEGTRELMQDVMRFIEETAAAEKAEAHDVEA